MFLLKNLRFEDEMVVGLVASEDVRIIILI